MSTILANEMAELQEQIYADNYYVDRYQRALDHHGVLSKGITDKIYSDKVVVNVANSFWFRLPEAASIRIPLFFKLCKISEHIFE